jgi:hypothetical protein
MLQKITEDNEITRFHEIEMLQKITEDLMR